MNGIVGLDALDRQIAAPARHLRFIPLIERTFEVETDRERGRFMIWTGLVAVLLYDAFLVNDWLTLHDRFPAMVVARIGIFTPILLCIVVAVATRRVSPVSREWLAAFGGFLGVLLPMCVMVGSASPYKLSYQFGSMLVMMFATVIQRLRLREAAVTLAGMLVVQFTADYYCEAFDTGTYIAIVTFFSSEAVLLLLAAYFMETSERRTFLLSLRGRILQDQLVAIARTDALTGLYNRRYLADFIDETWSSEAPVAISAILLDVDHFKLFNDSYGHLEGDECLRKISACLSDTVDRRIGSSFRFGGEEMLVLLPGIDPSEARHVADLIRRAIADAAIPHPALAEGAVVTASFGVAAIMAPGVGADDLVAAADTALYAAKRAGRNCVWPLDSRSSIAGQKPLLELKTA